MTPLPLCWFSSGSFPIPYILCSAQWLLYCTATRQYETRKSFWASTAHWEQRCREVQTYRVSTWHSSPLRKVTSTWFLLPCTKYNINGRDTNDSRTSHFLNTWFLAEKTFIIQNYQFSFLKIQLKVLSCIVPIPWLKLKQTSCTMLQTLFLTPVREAVS